MAYADPEVRKLRDRERFARRTAARRAAGLCPTCGKRPPAEGRSVCGGCAEKRNRASRARDARLREAGLPRRDPERARAYERERFRREAADRRAAGTCTRCGRAPAMPERSMCEDCLEKRRAADRALYEAGKAAGMLYGGKSVEGKRKCARAASAKRRKARIAAWTCTRCGRRPPVEGSTTCEPCRVSRRASERGTYAARRAAGRCVRCAGPVHDGGSRCAPCAVVEAGRGDRERRNARSRALYWLRRARSECTACGAPSQGAARCEPCAEKSYHGSAYFKGIPVWDPSFTVVELATGETLGCFDSEAEVAAALVFARLSFDQVEVLSDASPVARYAGWT